MDKLDILRLMRLGRAHHGRRYLPTSQPSSRIRNRIDRPPSQTSPPCAKSTRVSSSTAEGEVGRPRNVACDSGSLLGIGIPPSRCPKAVPPFPSQSIDKFDRLAAARA